MTFSLFLEDLEVGDEFVSGYRTVTAADVAAFGALTGDEAPIHTDPEKARAAGYDDLVAHGTLLVSWAVGLLAPLGLFRDSALGMLGLDDWSFRRPATVGTTVRSRMRVESVRESRSRPGTGVLLRTLVLEDDQANVLVQGRSTMLIRSRKDLR